MGVGGLPGFVSFLQSRAFMGEYWFLRCLLWRGGCRFFFWRVVCGLGPALFAVRGLRKGKVVSLRAGGLLGLGLSDACLAWAALGGGRRALSKRAPGGGALRDVFWVSVGSGASVEMSSFVLLQRSLWLYVVDGCICVCVKGGGAICQGRRWFGKGGLGTLEAKSGTEVCCMGCVSVFFFPSCRPRFA